MIALQLLWLVTIWLTDAASSAIKLPFLIAYTIVFGVAVVYLPANFVFKVSKLRERFVHNEKFLILTLCTIVFIAGGIYAYYQRVWPYDEENSFIAAKIVAVEGVGSFFAQYAQIPWLGFQHPPLIPLLNGFVMSIFGVNLFVIRLVSLILATATVVITYFLGRKLYDRNTGVLASFFLLSFPLFVRQGTTAMLDIPVMFFFSLALLLILHLPDRATYRLSISAGIIIIVGLFSKYTMAFIYPVLLSYFAIIRSFRQIKFHLGIIILIPFALVIVYLIYAAQFGTLSQQVNRVAHLAGISQNGHGELRLTSPWRMRFRLESLTTRLPSALGLYNIPLLFLGSLYFIRRSKQSDLLILLWIVVVSVPLIIILPDQRYFMVTFPALAILIAQAVQRIPQASEKIVILSLLYCAGASYLFVDWFRAAHVFVINH